MGHMLLIPVLRELMQEDCCKFKTSVVGYLVSSRLARASD